MFATAAEQPRTVFEARKNVDPFMQAVSAIEDSRKETHMGLEVLVMAKPFLPFLRTYNV